MAETLKFGPCRAVQRGPLEVEAEVRQALRRADRQVRVRTRQEEVAQRVVGDVQVRVDALVAAVALVGIDTIAGQGQRPRTELQVL